MFERLNVSLSEWGRILISCDDRTLFQTPQWLSFVTETQQAEPILAAFKHGSRTVGYFCGLIAKKCGIRILGSPLPGWTTAYMGLNLQAGVSRRAAVAELIRYAFRDWGCAHVELMDRGLSVEDAQETGFRFRRFSGFEIDLTLTHDQLFAGMTSACRRCIRKAQRSGVTIEEASDLAFADEYYAQLREVFQKQSLIPSYDVSRVRALIAHLSETNHLLLLRARDQRGLCIATGIFPAMHDTMFFWGGASRQSALGCRPNEALHWYAMRYWKARGMRRYDMGGGGAYKRKFGGREIVVPWIRASKYPGLSLLRQAAMHAVSWRQWLLGRAPMGCRMSLR